MCTITEGQIKADGRTVADALVSIANSVKAHNADLANQIIMAADGLANVTSAWTVGSAKADFDTAATLVETVLADIPQTAVFAPFVSIAVAALDVLLANIGTKPTPISHASVRATLQRIDALPPNPWRGKAQIVHHHWHSLRDDFVHAWNSEVDKNPTLTVPKLTTYEGDVSSK